MEKLLSIVIPVYNEANILQNTIDVIVKTMNESKINFELVFVDDGSIDSSWSILMGNSEKFSYIKGIKLSRNFGKESAMFAGLDFTVGDCCVVMDCDLQHPPSYVVEMYKLWLLNKFDIVEAKKTQRGKESLFYKISAGLFYKLLNTTSGINLEDASDFKLMDRKVVDIIRKMPERQTFFRAMSSWVGFSSTQIYFDVPDRENSKSKWSLKSLIKLATNAITSYSNLPMQVVSVFGMGFFVFALVLLVQTIYMKLSGRSVEGFTTVIILLLIMGSVIMFSLGVIGLYVAKIYEEIKYRPRYIVSDTVGYTKGFDKNGH